MLSRLRAMPGPGVQAPRPAMARATSMLPQDSSASHRRGGTGTVAAQGRMYAAQALWAGGRSGRSGWAIRAWCPRALAAQRRWILELFIVAVAVGLWAEVPLLAGSAAGLLMLALAAEWMARRSDATLALSYQVGRVGWPWATRPTCGSRWKTRSLGRCPPCNSRRPCPRGSR